MFTKLSEQHTYALAYVAILAVAFIAWRVIDAINKRGERFNERFATYRGTDPYESADTPDVVTEDVYRVDKPLPLVPTVDNHAMGIRRTVDGKLGTFPTRPIRDNPQA